MRGSYTRKDETVNHWFMRFGFPGISDIIGCSKDGRFIAIECKIKPNKPTELQEVYLAEIRKRGGIAVVAYDLNDVESIL
jgi:hypothetical protein